MVLAIPIPKLLIDKEDIVGFMEEFKGFHAYHGMVFEDPRDAKGVLIFD